MCFIDEKCYVSDPESDAIIKELQRMMDKVEEMKNQRAMLEDQFRHQIKNDDITNQIVAQDGGSNTMVRFLLSCQGPLYPRSYGNLI